MNTASSRLYVGRRLAAVFQRRVFGLSRLHDGATDSASPLYPIPRFDGRLVSVCRALRTVGLLFRQGRTTWRESVFLALRECVDVSTDAPWVTLLTFTVNGCYNITNRIKNNSSLSVLRKN